MTTTKTAVSIESTLLKQADALAQQLQLSRSRLFSLAVESYLRQHENQAMFDALNEVYNDPPDDKEQAYLYAMQSTYQKQLKDESW